MFYLGTLKCIFLVFKFIDCFITSTDFSFYIFLHFIGMLVAFGPLSFIFNYSN